MDKNKLWDTIIELRKENKELKEELAYVKFELEELRSKRYKTGKKPPSNDPDSQASAPKKKGGLFGHLGWFRKRPGKIDRVEEVKLSSCPECGSKDITECKKIDEHIQEDIVLPKVEAVLYRHHHYYCKHCKKVVSSKGKDELANSYIGPKAKAFAAFLRYGVKISERDVKVLFERAFNLKIVASSIAGFRYQLKRAGSPLYRILRESLKQGSFIHADETGWKVDGINHWLWKFSNKRILKRFARRLERHKDELLTFLYEKDVDCHNNHAEQQIRPDVIFRKITFGNRSNNGAQYHSVIMSILQTAKLNGIDPINTFKDILLGAKQYPLLNALAPP